MGSATDKDAISLFAKALKLHEGYPDTRLEVCRLLTTFAQRSDKAKDAIFKAIDIAYLFSLISKYPNDVLLINQIFGIFTVLTEKIRNKHQQQDTHARAHIHIYKHA